MIFRQATTSDFDDIVRVTGEGRRALAALGIDQWQGGTPTPEQIRADIKAGASYVAIADESDAAADKRAGRAAIAPGTVVGTVAACEGGEADYTRVTQGAWLAPSPNTPKEALAAGAPVSYVVLHRLAVAACATRRGVASFMMERCIGHARSRALRSVRADTHEGNIPMQRAFEKCGMARCCEIEVTNPLEATKKRIGYEIAL